MPKPASKPLTGEALLNKVKSLGQVSKEEKARICGYVTVTKSGTERVNMVQFQNALLEAAGIDLDDRDGETRKRGKAASYRVAVQANGNLLIGTAYTKQLNLEPGDEFEIKLARKSIRLKKVEADQESEPTED